MLPRLVRRRAKFDVRWRCLELPDGDLVDLAWSEDPQQAKHKPRLMVFHGPEGSLNSPHTRGLIEAAQKRGWLGVITRFRGCSGESNRLGRTYHSGETKDGTWFLHWLERGFGRVPIAAVGYSLGGNMLACLLAKEGNDIPIDAAATVLALFVLEACSYHMDKGSFRVYQRYLLNLSKVNASRKLEAYPGLLPVSLAQLKSLRRVRDFDNPIATKIHGFTDVIDYYRQCNAMPLFNRIAKPTLIICAKDDSFMGHHVIPKPENLPSQVEYQLTKRGGRIGFIGGTVCRLEMWLGSRIPDWLTMYLEASS